MAKTKIVGIINVTPDSFSDGGIYFDADFAILAIAKQIEQGADVIDIGAESTRPGATPLTPAEEWKRLEPVLKALPRFANASVEFSVDTRHPETAHRALAAGAHWINDVSGFSNPAMLEVVKSSDCKLVIMHSLTVPADKNIIMTEPDLISALLQWAKSRIENIRVGGISEDRIIFDPGIGFGKNALQSLEILRNVTRFGMLGMPLLIGHSRKSFLAGFQGEDIDDATLVVSKRLAQNGVDYLRVHNVVRHKKMLAVTEPLYG